jgi:hypothetical protein
MRWVIDQVEEEMNERREYEMTEAQLQKILETCRPVPYLLGSGGVPPTSPQENANAAWARLGREMGFEHMTVKPVSGKGQRFFTAVPIADPPAAEAAK